jgi:DNA-binding response OmpR family regulator
MTTADSARPGRILLVEDDHEAAFFAVHVLTTMGRFDVSHTADPRVALQRVRSGPWDLVLTDLNLPVMSGLELLGALRRIAPALPVAVITAATALDPAMDAARRQADAFLPKPIRAAQLIAAVTALIGRVNADAGIDGLGFGGASFLRKMKPDQARYLPEWKEFRCVNLGRPYCRDLSPSTWARLRMS